MKRLISGLVLAAFLALSGPAFAAAEAGDYCGGVKIGTISGFTGKYWVTDNNAVDVTLGSWDLGNLVVEGTLLMNRFGLFKSDRDDLDRRVTLYGGVGALAMFSTAGPAWSHAGMKATVGLAYVFPEPFEIYGEVSPVVVFADTSLFGFTGAIGARYYFGKDEKTKETKDVKADVKVEDKDVKDGEK